MKNVDGSYRFEKLYLDPEETLESLITVKLVTENEPIHKIKLPQEVLDKAKKATKEYNKSFI